ncbi:phosphatase 2C-like domain-containing protein [Phellopilus nigrolimitatus]|nr:phosphatase 2C-like domain-containing protein [Phellopilus nigrolimitatus]
MTSRLTPALPRTLLQCQRRSACRLISSASSARPYKIHVGVSFAGKPPEVHERPARRRRPVIDFPGDSDIARWRAETLLRNKTTTSTTAGEDFFYIQEVSLLAYAKPICMFPRNSSLLYQFFFDIISCTRPYKGLSFGVADGVGGWVDVGVDPSLFSQALMYHAHRYSKQAWAGEPETDPLQNYEEREQAQGWELTPKECLELAHGGVLREKTVEAGSSTACLVNVNTANGVLRAANLGDSGFCIFRSSNLFHYQPSQTHFFNCPKQISKVPLRSRRYGQAYTDSPREADTYETKLRDGDIVVVYTDGLSDNVFSNEMLQICTLVGRMGGTEDQQVQDMADRMVQYARVCMANEQRVSPFEIAAARAGELYRGGKVDE